MSYYYLISSLPAIILGEKPYYSSEEFMSLCSAWIGKSDIEKLSRLTLSPEHINTDNRFIRDWYKYEEIIRNSSVKNRAAKLNKDPLPYLKPEDKIYTDIERGVQDSFSAANPREKEMALDRLRWETIDFLETQHFFDLEKLCAYKLRLLICEKWIARKTETGQKNLSTILDSLYQAKDI